MHILFNTYYLDICIHYIHIDIDLIFPQDEHTWISKILHEYLCHSCGDNGCCRFFQVFPLIEWVYLTAYG